MAKNPRQKAAEQADGLARRIWLAGLGAYGQSLEDAQQHLGRAGGEASRLFQELVEKGQHIEDQSRSGIRKSIDDARSAISDRVGSNARSLEEMIRRVRDKVGLDAALSGRLDVLARRVDGIAQALGLSGVQTPGASPSSPPPRARASRKTAVTEARTGSKKPAQATRRGASAVTAPKKTARKPATPATPARSRRKG